MQLFDMKIETSMMYTIDNTKYHSFTEDARFGDSESFCHLKNHGTGMHFVENIDKLVWGIGNVVQDTKKDKTNVL